VSLSKGSWQMAGTRARPHSKKSQIIGEFVQLVKEDAHSYKIALEDAVILCYIALCITCLKLLIESRTQ
jgi:hypothetical protein